MSKVLAIIVLTGPISATAVFVDRAGDQTHNPAYNFRSILPAVFERVGLLL